jgi:glycosyltransferase involved in cell wall biosynthesis
MTSTIKILQVIPRLGFGGAETGCYDLAHFLAEKNCKSFLITSGGELLKYVRKDKVKVIRLPVHSKNPLLMLINFIVISIIILVYNIDIVHARSRAPAWSCFLSCFFTKRKFVTTFHGTYNFSSSIKLFYNSIMLKAELIIAGSNFIFNHINTNYQRYLNKKKKLMVIFRGINLDYFSKKNISDTQIERLLIEWKIEKNKKIILLPGRLTRWKGQEVFIEAISILAEEHGKHEFHAVILGSDQGRSVYSKKLIVLAEKNKIKNKLSFIKHCKNMPAAYKISDIVVSSSIEPEAFGRVSVEAQAMNVPIIASNLGGSMETILNNRSGFLFESGNSRELASALNSLMELDKDAIHKIGVEGRKNVTKKFNVDQMCQTTFTEYQKLLK